MLDNDTRILLVSDVHLGATETRLNQFTELLDYIIENDINLEAIIILGDFFDVMMDSYEGLSINKKNKTIYNRLDTIKSEKKIELIIALGNHEVPVTNSFFGTRTYDDKFSNRKDKLIRGFKKSGLKNKFLKEQFLCQYVVLKDNRLNLFDTKKQIKTNNPIYPPIDLKTNVTNGVSILLLHGHQLFEEETELAAPIWESCLKFPDSIKHIVNFLWNEGIKNIETEQNIKKFKEYQDSIEKEYKIKLNFFNRFLIKQLMTLLIQSEQAREKLKSIERNQEIKKFLDKYQLTINNVIYGHTHIGHEPKTYQNLLISNDGAWQHVDPGNFIEIKSNGSIEFNSYKKAIAVSP